MNEKNEIKRKEIEEQIIGMIEKVSLEKVDLKSKELFG